MSSTQTTQTGYRVMTEDNVATALDDLRPGVVTITGASVAGGTARAVQEIPFGHKMALQDIAAGGAVRKYGVVIATATRAIRAGEHVHLHNVRSNFDEKAASYDVHSARKTDVEYKLY